MTETEYSGTPLYKKLGFTKAPLRVLTINVPREYKGWLGELPKGVALASNVRPPVQAAHVFATESAFLNAVLSTLRVELAQDGFVWVWSGADEVPTTEPHRFALVDARGYTTVRQVVEARSTMYSASSGPQKLTLGS